MVGKLPAPSCKKRRKNRLKAKGEKEREGKDYLLRQCGNELKMIHERSMRKTARAG